MNLRSLNSVRLWQLILVLMIVSMVSIGGVTRLTRSGLSIVDWRPVTGLLPPLSDSEWSAEFQKYQSSPEFQQLNSNFSLSDYKNIFWWEYLHRVLGRLIFMWALLPGLWFWRQKMISGVFLGSLCGLVALQGLVGWLMVRSGLQNEPQVSPYFLALHFLSAQIVLLFAYRPWVAGRSLAKLKAIGQRGGEAASGWEQLRQSQRWGFRLLMATLAVQIFYGCLTSGMHAGHAFNTYPLMGGQFFPPGGLRFDPWLSNWLSNPATVQFTHRWVALLVLALALWWGRLVSKQQILALRGPTLNLLGVLGVQIVLGVLNIIYVVPISLGALHQLVATFLVMAVFKLWWRLHERTQNSQAIPWAESST